MGAAVVILLFVRHTAPVLSDEKYYGGSVMLMLPGNKNELRNFYRWQMLNQPSNIFGYNSSGVFSALLPEKLRSVMPGISTFTDIISKAPESVLPANAVVPLKLEKSEKTGSFFKVLLPVLPPQERCDDVPVFDNNGAICAVLHGLPTVSDGKNLLLKAEKNWAGTSFRIVESSGSMEFDRKAADALEQKAREGVGFSGMLAVWPKNGGLK